MKKTNSKSGKSHSASVKRSGSFFKTHRRAPFFAPVSRKANDDVQAKLSVSKPKDPLEREADRTASRVMRMSDEQVQRAAEEDVQREADEQVQTATEPPEVQQAEDEEAQRAADEEVQTAADERVQSAAEPPEVQQTTDEQVQSAAEPPEVQQTTDEQVQSAAEPPEVQQTTDEQVQSAAEPPEVQQTGDEQVQSAAEPPEVQQAGDEQVQRSADEEEVQRAGGGAPTMTADTEAEIRSAAGGRALSGEVRDFMEPRLGADLSDVRVHDDEAAHGLTNRLSSRAFTHRNHIFFGRNQYQPGTDSGRSLLAHELTHTIQQGATVQRSGQQDDAERPAVQRAPAVTKSGSTPAVQRLGVQDALDYFADKAHYITGFRMLTLILGFNPINMRRVSRTAANFLRALIELIPGGRVITQVLDNHGVINKAAAWVEQKVATLGDIGGQIVSALKRFLNSLSWKDIFRLGSVWSRAKRIFTDPIGRLIRFGKAVVGELLDIVKQAILKPLAALAQGTRGYDLLKAILGEDPITGERVPRTPEALIGGFMKLIGQEEVWRNLQRGKAVERAFAWFQGALAWIVSFARSIPVKIVRTLKSLTFRDVITVVGAFRKIGGAFLGMVVTFTSWAGRQVLALLEILVSVVAPGVMPYIKKAKGAFNSILKNPVGFVRNLVRAGRLGFQRFAGNILKHLKTALIKWLVGPLGKAGVYIPKSFSLVEVVKLVLSVLGITWQNVRAKLVKIIPEPVLKGLEKTAGILVTLVTEGPAAAWEQIKAELTELKDQLIGKVTEMIQIEIVKAAVKKLVSMINPAGAVVQAIIAIYNTVTFFVEKARQIGAVVASFINSIAAIAAGRVLPAAMRVEQTLANTLNVVLAFLAKFAGLGSIPDKLVGIVQKIRKPIDKALDKIVAWLGKMLQKLVAAAKKTAKRLAQWWKKKVAISGGDKAHTLTFKGEGKSAKPVVRSSPTDPDQFMTETADRKKISADDRKEPIATTQGHVGDMKKLQGELEAFDQKDVAPTGEQAKKADAAMTKLDTLMGTMATHIGKTLSDWGVRDGLIKGLKIARGSFTVTHKRNIAAEAKRISGGDVATDDKGEQLIKDSKGRMINVRKDLARRHVVSAHDMGQHYEASLNEKKASDAKLLIEQRGSNPDARTPVAKLSVRSVISAAKKRYKKFFGYARNIFLGDSRENSSIQEHLDDGHPELAGKKLDDHVGRIKREWALDPSMKVTPVKKK